jgi:hypothetical protein
LRIVDATRNYVRLCIEIMSSSKLDRSGVFEPPKVQTGQTQLSLAPDSVRVRKHGIEFKSPKAFPLWKEMTVEMTSPQESKKVRFTGVVVACQGNKHTGHLISMLITNMTRQDQARLGHMAMDRLA